MTHMVFLLIALYSPRKHNTMSAFVIVENAKQALLYTLHFILNLEMIGAPE